MSAESAESKPVLPIRNESFGAREMKGGEVHYVAFPMKAGEYCEITVEQKGIDVVITLIGPSGKSRGQIDGYSGARGNESTFLATEKSGEYRLEIRALDADSPPGEYVVTTGRRNANAEDHARDLALRIARAGSEAEVDAMMAEQPWLVNYTLAISLFQHFDKLYSTNIPTTQILFAAQQLLRIAKRVKDIRAHAIAYRALGNAYGNLGQYDLAIENMHKTIAIFEKTGYKFGLGGTMFNAALWYRSKGDLTTSMEYFKRSIPNYLAANENLWSIRAQNQIASCHVAQNNFADAYTVLRNSLQLLQVQEDPELKFNTLMQLGSTYNYEGRPGKSLEAYRAAYAAAEQVNQRPAMAGSSFAIATIYKEQGDLISAYSYFVKASRLYDSVGNFQRSTFAFVNISEMFGKVGRRGHAAEIYERAIKRIDVQIGRTQGYLRRGFTGDKVDVMNRLAQVRLAEGDQSGALRILEQAAILLDSLVVGPEPNQRIRPGSFEWYRAVRAKTYKNTGNVYLEMKRFSDARAQYLKALELAEALKYEPGIIETLVNLSSLAAKEGDHHRSIEYSLKAANFLKARKMDDRARIYTNLGRAYRNIKNIPEAEKAFGEAINIAENIRSDTTVKDLGATFSTTLLEPFDEYIEFLMEMHLREPRGGHDRRAFEISERRRSRALLDALKDARTDIRRGADPALLEKENQILNQINEAARASDPSAEAASSLLPMPDNAEQGLMQRPELDIAVLISEQKRVQTAIRAQSPRYAALTQPQPFSISDIEPLLESDTIVLNYTLGENRSYVWAISKGTVASHVLPPRAEIEASVKKVYKYLSAGASADSTAARIEYDAESARLSKLLLGPVASLLQAKRMVIVADGALQYVPFASLPDPRPTASAPLLASNEVTFAPSLSVVDALRKDSAKRTSPSKSIAIFADPVFSEDDERLTMKSAQERVDVDTLTRSLLLPQRLGSEDPSGPYVVPRLPHSREEGKAIFATAAPGSAVLAVDFDASRERAINRELSDFKIVHFATHGVLNSELPELSGLVLSLVNRKGEQVNGFLRLNEIYNMELNADLVVLSACETALGKEVRGEGLIGLTRGFMYAGSPRVVASLWKVDDVATAEFMKIFYRKLLSEGMRPAAALTATKSEMMKQKRWSSPYYWAAFELQGDWR